MRNKCSIKGCDKFAHGGGLCTTHYMRKVRHGNIDENTPIKKFERQNDKCSVYGCDNKAYSLQLCPMHNYRLRNMGHTGLAGRINAKSGEGHLSKDGYRIITVDGIKIKEHRYVMELKIGRKLYENENVHHVNGIRHDNRPDNLELWVTRQTKGQRIEDLLDWAYEILEKYSNIKTG